MTTRAPSPSSASVMRRTRPATSFRYQTTLPLELVTEVLEYLTITELWTAARVSRQFYASAWQAGLFIHRAIEWQAASGHADELAVFKDVLAQAQRKDLRLSLSLTSFFPAQHDPRHRAEVYAAVQSGADEIFPVITAALPFLVYLSTWIPDHFRPQLDSALRLPAPRLRKLEFSRVWSDVPCTLPISRDLFSGSAPLLHTLRLDTIPLPEAAVPAFLAVSQAALTYENVFPDVKFRDQFPNLNDLDLEFVVSDAGHVALPDHVDIRGPPLRSLVIEDGSTGGISATPLLDAIERSADLSAIPVVLVFGPTIRWNEKLWTKDQSGVSIRLRYYDHDDDLLVTVVPEHRRWRRLYRLKSWDLGVPVPIGGLPNLSERLTYLRMDLRLLPDVLQLELSFTALRQLHIDMQGALAKDFMLQPLDYNPSPAFMSFSTIAPNMPRVWAPCPVLEDITLFATGEPIEGVNSRRIAFFAHALGQHARPDTERVALNLVGVEFESPIASALLAETFSVIRRSAFAGRGSREDSDEGLWDCELFHRDLGDSSVAEEEYSDCSHSFPIMYSQAVVIIYHSARSPGTQKAHNIRATFEDVLD